MGDRLGKSFLFTKTLWVTELVKSVLMCGKRLLTKTLWVTGVGRWLPIHISRSSTQSLQFFHSSFTVM